jgi:hypothetical protein
MGHIACVGDRTNTCKILVRKPVEKREHGQPCVNGRIMLKGILNNCGKGMAWDVHQ